MNGHAPQQVQHRDRKGTAANTKKAADGPYYKGKYSMEPGGDGARDAGEVHSRYVGTTGGVVGGVPGGVVDGVPGGVFSEVLGSARSVPSVAKTPESTPIKRIRVASRVAEANLIHDVAPQYPPEAGRARVEGAVVLMAVIGKDGSVQDVRVESGLPLLAQAAIDAVRQWRYRPYLLNGEPVEVDSRITINFTLSRG
jgi:TonB family protein